MAVFAVAEHGVPFGGEVYAYLVGAPCFEMKFKQRAVVIFAQHFVVSDGKVAPVVHGRGIDHGIPFVLREPGFDDPFLFTEESFGERDVGALGDDVAPPCAHILLQFRRFGKDEQSACLSVEPVDDKDVVARVPAAHIGPQDGNGGSLARAGKDGNGEEAFFFLDDDEMVVLINHFQFGVCEADIAFAVGDSDRVSCAEWCVVARLTTPVDLHTAVAEELLDACAGSSCLLHKEIQQSGISLDMV